MAGALGPQHSLVPIVELAEVDSTNAEAMRRGAAGQTGPLWFLAHAQTGGRGRSGRSWTTLHGNLAASLLFAPQCSPAVLHQLSFVTAVAVFDAISPHLPAAAAGAGAGSGPTLRLKWPNDLLLGTAKLGGILIESTTIDGRLIAVAGIGINIAAAPALPDRATAALRDICPNIPTPAALVRAISVGMEARLTEWARGNGFAAIRHAWIERAGPLGEDLTITTVNGTAVGAFAGLRCDGSLLLRAADGAIEAYGTGDVDLRTGAEQGDRSRNGR